MIVVEDFTEQLSGKTKELAAIARWGVEPTARFSYIA